MPRHSVTVTPYHADRSICPPDHRHTTGGTPLTDRCTGQARFLATCTCGWTSENSSTKGYADEMGKRHRVHQRTAQPTGSQQPELPDVRC